MMRGVTAFLYGYCRCQAEEGAQPPRGVRLRWEVAAPGVDAAGWRPQTL